MTNGALTWRGTRGASDDSSGDDDMALGPTGPIAFSFLNMTDLAPAGPSGRLLRTSFEPTLGAEARMVASLLAYESGTVSGIGGDETYYAPRLPIRGAPKLFTVPLAWDGSVSVDNKSIAGVVVARGRVAEDGTTRFQLGGSRMATLRPRESTTGTFVAQHVAASHARGIVGDQRWSEHATGDVWITHRETQALALDPAGYDVAHALAYGPDGTLVIASKRNGSDLLQVSARARGASGDAVTLVQSAAGFDAALKAGVLGSSGVVTVDAIAVGPSDRRFYLLFSSDQQPNRLYARSFDAQTLAADAAPAVVYDHSSLTTLTQRTLTALAGSDALYVPGFGTSPDHYAFAAIERKGSLLTVTSRRDKDVVISRFTENAAMPYPLGFEDGPSEAGRYRLLDGKPRTLIQEGMTQGSPVSRYPQLHGLASSAILR